MRVCIFRWVIIFTVFHQYDQTCIYNLYIINISKQAIESKVLTMRVRVWFGSLFVLMYNILRFVRYIALSPLCGLSTHSSARVHAQRNGDILVISIKFVLSHLSFYCIMLQKVTNAMLNATMESWCHLDNLKIKHISGTVFPVMILWEKSAVCAFRCDKIDTLSSEPPIRLIQLN
jgi:hypothetical protein